ncbi:MAG TPA: hypothetical protein VGM90_16310 [Kofleriaceae bacterium]
MSRREEHHHVGPIVAIGGAALLAWWLLHRGSGGFGPGDGSRGFGRGGGDDGKPRGTPRTSGIAAPATAARLTRPAVVVHLRLDAVGLYLDGRLVPLTVAVQQLAAMGLSFEADRVELDVRGDARQGDFESTTAALESAGLPFSVTKTYHQSP